jgi:hypothetical protein
MGEKSPNLVTLVCCLNFFPPSSSFLFQETTFSCNDAVSGKYYKNKKKYTKL